MKTHKYHKKSLLEMKLHGDYFARQLALPTIDTGLSYSWIKNTHLRNETKSLLCAAQEQALSTKYVRSKIWKQKIDTKYRLCGEQDETVHHIVSGCKMLTANQYINQHNLSLIHI